MLPRDYILSPPWGISFWHQNKYAKKMQITQTLARFHTTRHVGWRMQDLFSLTRDWTLVPCTRSQESWLLFNAPLTIHIFISVLKIKLKLKEITFSKYTDHTWLNKQLINISCSGYKHSRLTELLWKCKFIRQWVVFYFSFKFLNKLSHIIYSPKDGDERSVYVLL